MRGDIARLAWSQPLALLLSSTALFVGYFAFAEANYRFVFPPGKSALFWLPSGLNLALFLHAVPSTVPSRWPGWLSAIFLAQMIVATRHGLPLPVAAAWGLAACLMPLSGALLLHRFAAPAPFTFRRVRDVVLFVGLGAAVASIPGALVAAAASVAWLGVPSFLTMMAYWWASDALGVILLGPLILTWITRPPRPPGGALEATVLLAALTGISWWVFRGAAPGLKASLPYLLIPLTAWSALRFGTRGATLSTVIIDFVAVWYTFKGQGPFAVLSASTATRLLNVQVYVAVVSVFALLMATVATQMREALAAAEGAERRTAFLADATTLLSESLNYTEILSRLAKLSVLWLADWCMIDIVEDGVIHRIDGAHADPAKERLVRELQERYAPHWFSPQPAVEVLRFGKALLFPEVTEEMRRIYCVDEDNSRLIRELGTRTAMIVPLVIRGKTIGVITFGSATPGRPYGQADLSLAQDLARRASVAVDNGRLFCDAEHAVRARDEFLSVASHELYTPITALLLSVQGLQRRIAASPELLLRSLARIERQVTRITRLAEELLSVSRITVGRLELHIDDVDLADLVRDVAERFTEELLREGYVLSVHAENPAIGRWDLIRLEQVVSNLLSNAIKFGANKPIDIAVRVADGTATLVVKDHGIGMPADRLPHIFDRFARAVPARSYGGLGLGLYIVRTIVEALGGSVRAESENGNGSTFTVELPCDGPPPKDADTQSKN